ncbi:MAG: hypothetical protein FGM61_07105 [Sediminibacterium sp.]|nr:hypothetical protein [Sediminibacterium sp.]
MSSILGYINLLLVLIQPSADHHEQLLQEEVMIPVTIEWVQSALPDANFQPVAKQPAQPEAVTHSNKALLSSGSIGIPPVYSSQCKTTTQLHNKARNAVKLFILYCQLKSDLFLGI